MAESTADVVVVAAGRSSRMGGVDKMTALIGGRPLLDWTLAAFADLGRIDRIVVVTAAQHVREVGNQAWLPARATVVAGGERRQESVASGVSEIVRRAPDADRIVLVHDGARPAPSAALVDRVIDGVARHGAAI